jgi:rubredoxin
VPVHEQRCPHCGKRVFRLVHDSQTVPTFELVHDPEQCPDKKTVAPGTADGKDRYG